MFYGGEGLRIYGRSFRENKNMRLARQIPARFMKVASYVAPMRDAGTPVNIEHILQQTIVMKKASFYEYRWLTYVWVADPKKFFELINNSDSPMDLKRGGGAKKVEKVIL